MDARIEAGVMYAIFGGVGVGVVGRWVLMEVVWWFGWLVGSRIGNGTEMRKMEGIVEFVRQSVVNIWQWRDGR